FGIEQSVIEDGAALEKLTVIALIGAAMTMQLVLARATATANAAANSMSADPSGAGAAPSKDDAPARGLTPRAAAGSSTGAGATPLAPASRVFDPEQTKVLHVLQKKLQGRTKKQQNPHPPHSLAWAAWTIARLGGWTGYDS